MPGSVLNEIENLSDLEIRKMRNFVGLLGAASLASLAHGAIAIQASSVAFVDISTTGTSIGTISDDSETTIAGATLNWTGNGLFAGGVSIRIGNNGGIIWGNSATDTFTGATEVGWYNAGPNNSNTPAGSMSSIGSMTAFNSGSAGNGGGVRQFIAPLWDDYTPVAGGATTSIRWQVVNNDLIVQWNRQDAFAATGTGDVTFQAIFRGGVSISSGASLVDFVYQDTLFQANQYQNDGGSATIGYKNWGINANANDVEFGIGGGGTGSTSDPAFGGLGMQPKVAGWVANGGNAGLPNSVSIIPAPGAIALLGLAGLVRARRRS
jgi:MYXO-CTERM domain-containing protein